MINSNSGADTSVSDTPCNSKEYYLSIASRACHDIRNYTGLISGYCQLIADKHKELNSDPMWIKLIAANSKQLKLLDDIAAYRYSLSDQQAEVFNFPELLDSLNINCSYLKIVNKSSIGSYHGSFSNILYALQALINNSIDACSSCDFINPEIILEIYEDSQFIHFKITDNGCGFTDISPSECFEPFSTTKKGHTGTGLSCVYNTAKIHGGNVNIISSSSPTVIDFYIAANIA